MSTGTSCCTRGGSGKRVRRNREGEGKPGWEKERRTAIQEERDVQTEEKSDDGEATPVQMESTRPGAVTELLGLGMRFIGSVRRIAEQSGSRGAQERRLQAHPARGQGGSPTAGGSRERAGQHALHRHPAAGKDRRRAGGPASGRDTEKRRGVLYTRGDGGGPGKDGESAGDAAAHRNAAEG